MGYPGKIRCGYFLFRVYDISLNQRNCLLRKLVILIPKALLAIDLKFCRNCSKPELYVMLPFRGLGLSRQVGWLPS